MTFSRLAVLFLVLSFPVFSAAAQSNSVAFSWDQATVYRSITDRFSNGDRDNNAAYGRGLDGAGGVFDVDSTGHFLGGDYSGLQGWVEDGYFNDLGINTLWITAPYEQVHGWVGGGSGEFQKYGFEGTWPLDFTEPDLAYGNLDEFIALVDAAHLKGLRVLIEVSLSHVGPATMNDMAAFGFGGLTSEEWRSWRPSSKSGWQSYNNRLVTTADSTELWAKWWGPDWVRADLPGYESCQSSSSQNETPALVETAESVCTDMMPMVRDDVSVKGLPAFLQLKWGPEKVAKEQAALDFFFERTGYERTATNHLIKWLSDWIQWAGIDGFVLRDAAQIHPDVMSRLKKETVRALNEWKTVHSAKALDEAPFWLSVDVPAHGVLKSDYFAAGADGVLNYAFRGAMTESMASQYAAYAESINKDASLNVLSFLSSGDVGLFDRSKLHDLSLIHI